VDNSAKQEEEKDSQALDSSHANHEDSAEPADDTLSDEIITNPYVNHPPLQIRPGDLMVNTPHIAPPDFQSRLGTFQANPSGPQPRHLPANTFEHHQGYAGSTLMGRYPDE
jgi:hypothetical protein